MIKQDACPESRPSAKTRRYCSSYLGKAKSLQQKGSLEYSNCTTRASREKLGRLLCFSLAAFCACVFLQSFVMVFKIYQGKLFSGGGEHFHEDRAVQRRDNLPGASLVRTSTQLSSVSSSASILKGRFSLLFVLRQPMEFCSGKTWVMNMFAIAITCNSTAWLDPRILTGSGLDAGLEEPVG